MHQSNKETMEQRFDKEFNVSKVYNSFLKRVEDAEAFFDKITNVAKSPRPEKVKSFIRSEINAKLDEVIREAEGMKYGQEYLSRPALLHALSGKECFNTALSSLIEIVTKLKE